MTKFRVFKGEIYKCELIKESKLGIKYLYLGEECADPVECLKYWFNTFAEAKKHLCETEQKKLKDLRERVKESENKSFIFLNLKEEG